MPFVRIDALTTLADGDASALGEAVHRALVRTFNVPQDDRFQVVARHPPAGLIVSRSFLGVSHGQAAVLIQIDCAPGRTREMKQSLFAAIAEEVQRATPVSPDDVIVHLVETARENWSFGQGVAQLVA
jgi:phenylpyruvate tautomerase PptA (4-oxalocrotonate tautomerase family)